MQNRSHINALSQYLGLPREVFFSFVIFSERCELKKVPPSTPEYCVIRRPHLVREVNRVLELMPHRFSPEEFDAIAQRLSSAGKTEEKAAAHIREVKGIQDGTVCPLCGKQLVRRSGKYGEFMGCSGYPKCRFTRGIE